MNIKNRYLLILLGLLAVSAALAGCHGNQASTVQSTISQPAASQPPTGQDANDVPDTQPDGRVRQVQPGGND